MNRCFTSFYHVILTYFILFLNNTRRNVLPSHTMTGYSIACNENTKTRFRSRTQFFITYFPVNLSHHGSWVTGHRDSLWMRRYRVRILLELPKKILPMQSQIPNAPPQNKFIGAMTSAFISLFLTLSFPIVITCAKWFLAAIGCTLKHATNHCTACAGWSQSL